MIAAKPLLNPAKSGAPAIPRRIYCICEIKDQTGPIAKDANRTVKTCIVNGTGVKGRYKNEFAESHIKITKTSEREKFKSSLSLKRFFIAVFGVFFKLIEWHVSLYRKTLFILNP